MEGVTKLLLGKLGQDGLKNLAEKFGADQGQVAGAMESAVPTLLNAISTNTKSPAGATNFLSALERDHDGSILDNIGGLLQNPQIGKGAGILKHVLGDKRGEVENQLAAKSGLSAGNMGGILEIVAPLLMGFLGKQKKQAGTVFSSDNISSVLSALSGGKGLDISSLLKMAGGAGSTPGEGLMGTIGGLFGKK